MKKFVSLCLLLSLFAVSRSQDNSYLLYSLKGNVTVVENKVESKAKIGKVLTGTNTLKLAPGSVVTLICNEVAMFSIKAPGSYTLSQFADSCAVSKSSVSANYVRFVWAQMTKSGGSAGSDRKKFMNTVGAVSRSVNNIWIDPRLDTVNYAGGEFPLSWKSYADAKEFDFTLFASDNNKEPVYKTTVSKLKVPITSFIGKLKPGSSYLWTAAVKAEQNDELKVLNYVSKESFQQLLKDLKSFAGAFESAAEEAYRIAFLLEDAHYLPEALQYYTKAATLDPATPLYRSTLMSFKKDYEIK